MVTMAEGGSAEVGLTGHEGLVGAMQLFGRTPAPSQSCILMEGSALRIRLDDLRPIFLGSQELRCRILEFVQQQHVALVQVAACNKLHEAEQRLARWLLMCRDRSELDTMTLTQEFMADMQERGMISYRRGKVTILSVEELEKAACNCYRICNDALRSLYRPHCE
jgi:CRP-like cAMP-binding protein